MLGDKGPYYFSDAQDLGEGITLSNGIGGMGSFMKMSKSLTLYLNDDDKFVGMCEEME